jgi:DNA-binding ferritin-like protein
MTKNIKYNIKHLKFISRNANGEDVKQKINTIIELYATRKISQVQTASNNIMNLLTTTTVKKKETVNKKYEKLIEKYQAVETLSNRLRQKTTVRNEKKEKQITAASKIQKVTRNKVVFEVEEIAKAFKGKVINLSVRSKTIGSAIATDIDALAARAYLMARRKAPKESEFKVWGSVSFDWISLDGETSFITKST